VITICDHLKNLKYAKALPNAFTEHGAIMAASVLNTEKVIQISRLESPSYEGHSLSMLRRVAEVLGATIRIKIQHKKHQTFSLPIVAEPQSIYRVKRRNQINFRPEGNSKRAEDL